MSLIPPDSDDPLLPDHVQERYPRPAARARPGHEPSPPDRPDRGRDQSVDDVETARAAAQRQAVQDPLQRRPD